MGLLGGGLVLRDESSRLEDLGILKPFPLITQALDPVSPCFLWEQEQKVLGALRAPHQQATQDCTSHAFGKALEDWILQVPPEVLPVVSTEVLYGGSRVQIGANKLPSGSCCAWVAAFVLRYGFLPRDQYGQYDLSHYSVDLANQFGAQGVPDDLLQQVWKPEVRYPGRQLKIGRLRTAQDAWRACWQRCPLPFATKLGFSMARGPGGVCGVSGTWDHAMVIRGRCVLQDGRQCVAVQNSVGDYLGDHNAVISVRGREEPVVLPSGVFLMELEVLDKIAKQEDLYVLF